MKYRCWLLAIFTIVENSILKYLASLLPLLRSLFSFQKHTLHHSSNLCFNLPALNKLSSMPLFVQFVFDISFLILPATSNQHHSYFYHPIFYKTNVLYYRQTGFVKHKLIQVGCRLHIERENKQKIKIKTQSIFN